MKRSLAHLPPHKREHLKYVADVIREIIPDVQMIILFGSHARGDWVEDEYEEDHITYSYISDYDILVVPEKRWTIRKQWLLDRIDKQVGWPWRSPSLSLIAHDIKDFNKRLACRSSFFTDIKKEGVLLYDSKKYKLERARKLSPEERQKYAKEDFGRWFRKANVFFVMYECALARRHFDNAAFQLHQATENAYHAFLLAFTGYKPKLHDLTKLGQRASAYCTELLKIFPQQTKEEKRLFELLRSAYVDARYKKDYKITKKELAYLAERVKKLHVLVSRVCKRKIKSFTENG